MSALRVVVPEKSQAPSQAQVVVLDTLRMEWSKPIIGGLPARVRTRHTAVAVYSDEDDLYDGKGATV